MRSETVQHSRRGPSRPDRLASIISYVINPLVLPVIGVALVAFWGGGTGAEIARVSLVGSVFFALVPLGVIWLLLRMGRVDSLDVRVRQKRLVPFVAGVASFAAGLLTLAGIDTPAASLLFVLTLCLILNAVLMTLITLAWKISIHAAGIGSLVGLLLFLNTVPILPTGAALRGLQATTVLSLLSLPAVMWARVRLRAHTVNQVVAGAAAGIILPYAELYFLWKTGILLPI